MENAYYEMYSRAGDRACHRLVTRALRRIASRKRLTGEEILQFLQAGVAQIGEKHPEVTDTEPAAHIAERVNAALREVGYSFQVSRYDF